MAILNTTHSVDMTSIDFADLRDGTNTSTTDTVWEVTGALGFTDYTFSGTGLTYGGNGRPNGGLVTNFSFFSHGTPELGITGNISAATLGKLVTHNSVTALLKTWFAHDDLFNGSSFDDHVLGFKGNDRFNLVDGGEDTAEGGDGNDTFVLGDSLSIGDRLFGGVGFGDKLILDGPTIFTFAAGTMDSIEHIEVKAGSNYELHFHPNVIPDGDIGLDIDASDLHAANFLSISTTIATTKSLLAAGGRGADTLIGSKGIDSFHGNRGNDYLVGAGAGDNLEGGDGGDTFEYRHASDSFSIQYDGVQDFHEAEGDRFALPFSINDVNAPITAGHVDFGSFDTDLAALIHGPQMGKHDAVLITPDDGNMAGQTFLIIDFNNKAGYQAGKDVVIFMDTTAGLAVFDEGAFIAAA